MKRESRSQEFVWGFQYSLLGSKIHHLGQEKSNSLRGSTEVVNIHYLGQIQNLGQNNSLSILERKLQDNENSFNIKLTKIESELETLRGKLATTTEKLSRLERAVKNNSDNRNEITITSQDLQSHRELINKLKEENALISNDLNHLFSRL